MEAKLKKSWGKVLKEEVKMELEAKEARWMQIAKKQVQRQGTKLINNTMEDHTRHVMTQCVSQKHP